MIGRRIAKAGKSLLKPGYFRYLQAKANRRRPSLGNRAEDSETDRLDHILIVVVDAWRPDCIPELPMEFTTAIAPGTWTFPSVTSLHTGQYPHDHGCNVHVDSLDGGMVVPEQYSGRTILDVAHEFGYDSFAGCGFLMPFLAVQGWYRHHQLFDHGDASDVIKAYQSWRDGRDRTFGYLHLADLHEPLSPPDEYVSNRDIDTSIPDLETWDYVSTYDGEDDCKRYRENRLKLYRAAFDHVEANLNALIDDYGDSTLLLVTGDHGESHWEQYELAQLFTDARDARGAGHGGTPFDMTARVPIGLSDPTDSLSLPGSGWPSLIDLPRTLSSVVGSNAFDSGMDWSDQIPATRPVRCEASRYGVERKAVYSGRKKLIQSVEDGVTLVGTIDSEYNESLDSADQLDSTYEPLSDALPRDAAADNGPRKVNTLTAQQLEALGYK